MLENNENTLKEVNKIYMHKHIISNYMSIAINNLVNRSLDHDNSKLTPEELEGYVQNGPILDKATIGTKEYEDTLDIMKGYNEIHYSRNRHHPEHFNDGINDMNLIDILEMFCDWCAKSDEKNTDVIEVMENVLFERFDIDDQLADILKNTIKYFRANNSSDISEL